MQAHEPSVTALAAARHRAAHQVLEAGFIFSDPLALKIIGVDDEASRAELVRDAQAHPERRPMRVFIAVRARFAQDCLAQAVGSGVRQLVTLGAGLDTFAYRNPFGDRLQVFEVDHPATQAWKRERLAACQIALPASLRFVAIDFERETLDECLAASGFDPAQPSFFSWLGVVPYLTRPAIFQTLSFIAALSGGAHVVFDYGNPPHTLDAAHRAHHELRAARVASLGEAFVTYFDTRELAQELGRLGFTQLEDLGPREFRDRYLPQYPGPVPEYGGHIVHASR